MKKPADPLLIVEELLRADKHNRNERLFGGFVMTEGVPEIRTVRDILIRVVTPPPLLTRFPLSLYQLKAGRQREEHVYSIYRK